MWPWTNQGKLQFLFFGWSSAMGLRENAKGSDRDRKPSPSPRREPALITITRPLAPLPYLLCELWRPGSPRACGQTSDELPAPADSDSIDRAYNPSCLTCDTHGSCNIHSRWSPGGYVRITCSRLRSFGPAWSQALFVRRARVRFAGQLGHSSPLHANTLN